jgi:hypothetical protein
VVTANAPIRLKLAVRTLAQLTCRRGDIHFRYDEATDSQEGISLQKKLQRDRAVTYQREGNVAAAWKSAMHGIDVELLLAGRADGWDRELGVVEEFKTTRIDPARLYAQVGSVHIGQLLYAALFARDTRSGALAAAAAVLPSDTGVVMAYEETVSAATRAVSIVAVSAWRAS